MNDRSEGLSFEVLRFQGLKWQTCHMSILSGGNLRSILEQQRSTESPETYRVELMIDHMAMMYCLDLDSQSPSTERLALHGTMSTILVVCSRDVIIADPNRNSINLEDVCPRSICR